MATDSVYFKDLTEIEEIDNGIKLVLSTPDGDRLIDYQNFIIGTDNTTFADQLSALDTTTAETSAALDSEVATLTDSISALDIRVTDIESTINENTTLVGYVSTRVTGIQSLTDGTDIVWDLSKGSVGKLNLTGASHYIELDNGVYGETYKLIVVYSGAFELQWRTQISWSGASSLSQALSVNPVAGDVFVFTFLCDQYGSNSTIYYGTTARAFKI